MVTSAELYDQIVTVASQDWVSEPIEPYWAIDDKDIPAEAAKLDWFERAVETTELSTLVRMERQLLNRFAYRGIAWENQDPFGHFTRKRQDLTDSIKMTVPDLYRYTRRFAARLLKFKGDTIPSPTTNEFADKQGARVAKLALETVKQQFDFEEIEQSLIRRLPTDGESYLLTLWDDLCLHHPPRIAHRD